MSNHEQKTIDALIAAPQDALIAIDFDGTLAPIVSDPARAFADRVAVEALARIGGHVGHVAIVTGRPVATVLELGDFVGRRGLERLTIFGQYGAERWDSATGIIEGAPTPGGMPVIESALPAALALAGVDGAFIEHKGRALVVHTRTLDDPQRAFDAAAGPVRRLAEENGMVAEPGRFVWEIRDGVTDKGTVLRAFITEIGARTVVFAGDDLGDLPAFDAVDEHREHGGVGMLVCSASHEQDALAGRADLVVDGPVGIATWLTELAEDIGSP